MPSKLKTNSAIVDAIAAAMLRQMGITNKAVSTTPDALYGHGPTGLFSAPGVDPEIYNAMQLPNVGLEALLPEFPTNLVTPVYNIVTGQTATSGAEPTIPCADWPEAGVTKLCGYQTTLSRQGRSSRVFDISRVGQQINRADMMDYTLVGDPMQTGGPGGNGPNNGTLPTFPGGAGGNGFLNNELAKAMRELKIAFVRDFSTDIYSANPANNAGTGRLYYKGLDLLINTGYADYETTVACPASDSIIGTFGNADISLGGVGSDLVFAVTDIFRRLQIIADEAGMNPVTWVLAMPRSLFYEAAAIWPCAYYTARCPLPAGATQFVEARDQIQMRDDMRNGSYLMVDGKRVMVVQDTAIPMTALAGPDLGSYTGSIYFVPLKVRGNKASLYKQYFNWNAPGAAIDFVKAFGNLSANFQASDNGKFLWLFQPPSSYCIQFEVMARQTLVLRTPYLAARLNNVRWTPLNMERSPYPGAATYVNGGKTNR